MMAANLLKKNLSVSIIPKIIVENEEITESFLHHETPSFWTNLSKMFNEKDYSDLKLIVKTPPAFFSAQYDPSSPTASKTPVCFPSQSVAENNFGAAIQSPEVPTPDSEEHYLWVSKAVICSHSHFFNQLLKNQKVEVEEAKATVDADAHKEEKARLGKKLLQLELGDVDFQSLGFDKNAFCEIDLKACSFVLPEENFDMFKRMIWYCYSGEIAVTKKSDLIKMLLLGIKYEIDSLQERCVQLLKFHMNKLLCIKTYFVCCESLIADSIDSLRELKKVSEQFFIEHFCEMFIDNPKIYHLDAEILASLFQKKKFSIENKQEVASIIDYMNNATTTATPDEIRKIGHTLFDAAKLDIAEVKQNYAADFEILKNF